MHTGRNISKVRELLGVKQEALAMELGLSQQTISKIEQTENLPENSINKIAAALKIEPEIITNYNEPSILSFLKSGLNDPQDNKAQASNKVVEQDEKLITLYERLLKCEQEKFQLLLTLMQHPVAIK